MICNDDKEGDYTHWFHKNIQFNGEYDYFRFRNALIKNQHFKLIKTTIYKKEKDSFNKIVEKFVCTNCFNFFLLCSSTTGERLYEPPYYQQITVGKLYFLFVYLKIRYVCNKLHTLNKQKPL